LCHPVHENQEARSERVQVNYWQIVPLSARVLLSGSGETYFPSTARRMHAEQKLGVENRLRNPTTHLTALEKNSMSSPQHSPTPPGRSNGNNPSPATVQVHALSAGHFSIPEVQFISPTTSEARKTVPSLCFLIQHRSIYTGQTTRIVFDLGLRRDINRYSEPIRNHVRTRQPLTTDPDTVKSLRRGGLAADDIDYVILSHVRFSFHWLHLLSLAISKSEIQCVDLITLGGRSTGIMLASHETFQKAYLSLATDQSTY
jgi:hypothetical protein